MDPSYSRTAKDDLMGRIFHPTIVKSEPSDGPRIKPEAGLSPPASPPLTSVPLQPAQHGAFVKPESLASSEVPAGLGLLYQQPSAAQDPFQAFLNDQSLQLPAILPAYKRPDWWMDVFHAEDVMLVTILTLDGRSAKTISRQLKISLPPTANQDLNKPDTVYDVQRKIGGIFRGRHLPMFLMPHFAHGMIAGFRAWCTKTQGLPILGRAKEIEDAQGDRAVLQNLARKRRNSGIDIAEQFGYTDEWAARQDDQDIWKSLLLEWWTHGTVNGAMIPKTGF